MCYGNEPSTANTFLRHAYNKSMVNAEYVYIIPYYMRTSLDASPSDKAWQSSSATNNSTSDQLFQQIYQRVLVVRSLLEVSLSVQYSIRSRTVRTFRFQIQATGEEPSLIETFQETVEQEAAEIRLNTSIKLTGKVTESFRKAGRNSRGTDTGDARLPCLLPITATWMKDMRTRRGGIACPGSCFQAHGRLTKAETRNASGHSKWRIQ